jgi:hypothetical protein
MRYIFVVLLLTGCSTVGPTRYGQHVRIIDGPYKGEVGKLVGDCSWFENYRIKLYNGRNVCVRIWHLEAN